MLLEKNVFLVVEKRKKKHQIDDSKNLMHPFGGH